MAAREPLTRTSEGPRDLVSVDEAPTEVAAGRAAADRLAREWPDRSWVPTSPSDDWARGAIERFGELLREQPAIFRASREGSERGAESLSPRPFQGLLECLENRPQAAGAVVTW